MSERAYEGIAIIGMSGRFPGAENVEEFWANLVAGKETVSFFSDAEMAEAGLDPVALKRAGNYIPARGVLKDADCFDAAFFGIHPKEAEVTDPQQRVFLEACWTALERAGYAPNQMRGSVGVFAGVTFNTYYLHALHSRPELIDLVGPELVMYGNEKDYLTTRVAYKLGLKGPALNVSTACSTSLVAVGQACQSLLTYQCDVALAGGASVRVPQQRGYYYDEGNIGSSDGHTRTFDAQAAGTVFSNGVAVVVLKRLEDAVNDGDHIYAVIKGAALNNDGSQRVSFGAPGVEGQSEVIAMAHALAGIDPRSISYVEAHGTATPLGDPIEIAGLTKAFRMSTDAKQFCGIGSVKTNVGHLDAASGVTGLIKTALSLYNKTIPASLHFTKPNPKLDLENSPFYVNANLQEWKTKSGEPRRAGVSSFGTGGTNAHVVLEETPDLPSSGASRPWQLLVLSAKTTDALDRAAANLAEYLQRLAVPSDAAEAARELADAAFTLQVGRSEFTQRRIVACQDAADGSAALLARDAKRVFTHHQQWREPPVVFMFPGQGAQYAGMGAELYRTEETFRAEVDRCAELLKPVLKKDIRTVMFPKAGAEKESEELLVQTRFTQPALFVIEYALAKLWMSWGVKPAAMIGHSVGEYVAGCLAGVFTLEDALTLIARRAELVQAQPGGTMLAIRLPEAEVLPLLNPQITIAAINSVNLCVVSGPYDAIDALEEQLAAKKIAARRLNTSHAFHSPMMEPVLAPFTELLRKVKLGEPQIPYVSNVTAKWINAAEAASPEYWAGHVRQTVRFADGVAEFMKDPRNVLLEVGPGQTLSTLARQHPSRTADQTVLASLPLAGAQELRGLLEALGRLWMTGTTIDWQGFYAHELRRRVVLPTYPFERKRYWPDSAASPAGDKILEATPRMAPDNGGGNILQTNTLADVQSAPAPQAAAQPAPVAAAPRKERLLAAASSLLHELSGYDLSGIDTSASLLELGLDSLLLTQAAQLFQRRFGVPVTFRQLMEELGSLEEIATYLDATMPPEALAPPTPAAAPAAQVAPVQSAAAQYAPAQTMALPTANLQGGTLEQILLQQQILTTQLLQLMTQGSTRTAQPAPVAAPPSVAAAAPPATIPSIPIKSEQKSHGPFKPIDRGPGAAISDTQKSALDALISRYLKRTGGSKKIAAENRAILADPRSVSGFNKHWKEMVYQIVTNRSDGSRVWDVDGNEYVDFVMGFGASLFGHRPPFVVKAVHEQLDRGFEIGPIQPVVGEVAALVKEFSGMQRVGFTNTGSEAVLAATRVARTVTGRDKIAVFAGAYHGIFDEVLFRPLTINGETRTAPIAPGIPNSAVGEVIVLDYGNPQSLDIIRARGSEIAAVLVEPVQSRRLDLQPREFLHDLRRVTEETGSALIFDEVVTGFRVEPGGAQAHFGVRADLATYGKVVGGGLPIGVVTGIAKFMDALDGGNWQYGDASFPEVGVTFFAGTFVRHPLALAAAKAVLLHLKQAGPKLQQNLTARTAQLADEMRAVIEEFKAPYHLTQFSSLIQLGYPADQKFAGLLFYLLRERGIHIYDNRAFVMTTAHSEADLAHLIRALRESLAEMQTGGFLPPSGGAPQKSHAPPGAPETKPQRENEPAVAGPRGAAGSDAFPLTEAQKEIWLASQMGGDAALGYNESLKLDFRGPFDVELFRRALKQIVERHPILLANFSADGLSQRINKNLMIDAPLLDLSGKAANVAEKELAAIIDREVAEPFDLRTGPLLRIRIARLSPDHHVVIWTAHHIVCDGWSGGLLLSELAKIYSASKKGTATELEAPESFPEYARTMQGDTPQARADAEYWRKQFVDLPAPLELPTDRLRPAVRTARASTLKRDIPEALHLLLKRTAGQQRTTLVVLLMAGLKTLLYRLTGQTDLVVGLGVAGQAITGKNCLVGHCVNLLPVRTRLDPAATFQQNLAAVKRSVLDGYDHNQTTVGELLQSVKVPRSPGRPPLVEVIFNIDRDASFIDFEGLKFSSDRNPKRALHYDMFFNFVEGAHSLYVECDYNTDLFDHSTMERWLKHLQTLLESITASPTELIGKLPILSEAERHEIVVKWNDTATKYPEVETLQAWFESQVERTPGARAVTAEDKQLSYQEFNRRANQVAHHLKALGVGPDVRVGVCAERSLEMVVALMGILKAGGAYMPLDPDYPGNRLALMLEDAQPLVILTQQALLDRLPPHAIPTICLDSEWSKFASEPDSNLGVRAGKRDAAYVIYTSGSTGKPKGVVNIHEGIVNRLQWMQDAYRLTAADRILQKTPYSFDVSVWEFFWPLVTGASLVFARPGGHRDPAYLAELIAQEGITTLHFVPSMLRLFLEAVKLPAKSSIRQVFCSGEELPADLQRLFFANSNAELHNLYGPTEAAVDVTYWACRRDDRRSFVPIGRPIANTQIYILDQNLGPVPIGVSGELHIGGIGLARGYLNRPELTAERFIPDAVGKQSGARLYKTGDLSRYLASGDIQYLGRIDNQVKIRGFRIELGEIAAVLGKFPAVKQCVVTAREDTPGEKVLVAYYEAQGDATLDVSELRAYLQKEIPEYMVPAAFVRMDKLPLSANGKVDIKALPAPESRAIEDQGSFLAPTDSIEQVLAQLWSKVLKVKRVGLNDNFFELGGHSLLAVRIIVEIEKIYNRRLPLATLLQAPTVGALAEVLRRENWQPSWSSLVAVQPGGSKPPLFLIHSHGGNVLEYYPLATHLGKDQPVFALQARGLDGNIEKNQTLEQMASAYLQEIRSLQPEGPYLLGGFCFGGLVALEAAQQLQSAGQKVGLVVMIQTTHPASQPFLPGSGSANRWWHRTTKRIDLERENLSHRGSGYFGDRIRRTWDVMRARTQIAMDKGASNGHQQKSMAYILEILGIEHDRAFDNYVPRPYHGDVLLFRASKQLPGMISDSSLGWRPVIKGNLKICELPGHQQNILIEPRVVRLAEELATRLQPSATGEVTEAPTTVEPVLVNR
jgi:amino acid adenylation domain-containing protein